MSAKEKQDIARYGARSRAGTKGAIMKREGIKAGQTPPNTMLSTSGASSSGLPRDIGPVATVSSIATETPLAPLPKQFLISRRSAGSSR